MGLSLGATAAVITAVAAVASVGTSFIQGRKAADRANRAEDEQRKAAKVLADARPPNVTAQKGIPKSPDDASRVAAKSRKQKQIIAGQGRSDTILTSPLGIIGEPELSRKTLLGA